MISFIIPTLNEEDVIADLIAAIFRHVDGDVEVIVVDDSPGPATAQVIAALGDPRIHVVRRGRPRGLASAILRGILESRGEIVGWMDADAWMLPERLPAMIAALTRADLAVASRYVAGGGDDRERFRVLASRLINGAAQAILGDPVRDYTSCFVVMRRTVFDVVLPDPHGFGEFFVEFLHKASRGGLRVVEVPYVLKDRAGGISKASPNMIRFLRLGLHYLLRIMAVRLRG
ncbi:MAG: glycosyltransferase [Magnetospirillum sp.]|nr:glycosyltransferase [Magnetospirillum sp.]